MTSLKDFVVGDVGTIAGLSLAAVGLVWLIASANASSLLIARVTSRRQELAVRAALGASRGRVVRYLLVESALLAFGAVMLGTVVAWAGSSGSLGESLRSHGRLLEDNDEHGDS